MKKIRENVLARARRAPQQGFALLVALIFLIALTVIGVSVLRTSTLNERVVGNDLDRQRAYQAAEAAIRDAQKDILQLSASGSRCIGQLGCRDSMRFPSREDGETDLTGGCDGGMCFFTPDQYRAPGFLPPWKQSGVLGPLDQPTKYGTFSGATFPELNAALGSGLKLSREPEYWIEILARIPTEKSNKYRITVRGYGINPNTTVTLQEIYAPGV